MVKYTHDAFSLLDGGWRVLNGQVPHVNFYTGLGPIIYLQSALGLLLANGRAEGLGYIQGITGLVLASWTLLLCKRRLNFILSGLMSIFVALLTVAPLNTGDWPSDISAAMIYNRYGYALLCLVLIESFTTGYAPQQHNRWGGISTGAAGALMLFSKVSYFVVFAFLLAFSIFLKKQTKTRWTFLLGSFGAVSLMIMMYLQFHASAMWHDIALVAKAKHVSFGEVFDRIIVNTPLDGARSVLIAIIAAVAVWPYVKESGRSILIATLAVNLASVFLLSTNFQVFSFPLDTVLILLIIDRVNMICRKLPHPPIFGAALLLGGVFCMLTSTLPDITALTLSVSHRLSHNVAAKHFETPPLANFYSLDTEYVDFVNDGFRLLKQYRRPSESIMSLDFTNPFSYGLQARPAQGGTTWLQYNVDFDYWHKPSGEELLGSADLVMFPIRNGESTLRETVPRLYGTYLGQHFTVVGESAEWRLFRRNR